MEDGNRIALLDIRLANQIAAGEVVERPASVVKELLENSIDAGATRIEVDIERGGARLIRITDNGHGIHKDDLPLALTRHATSKIKTTEDLANIHSLGFRGEALASISSVARLTLTSRQQDNELAWQAVAQGRDMAVEISPAAAAPGTRIEIRDLFYNTPARQKFLRAEKTEFNHIETIFKSHALANFEVAFVLKHNHKLVKRIPASGEASQRLKRVAAICGQGFSDNALAFECQHEFVRLSGWLGRPEFHRSESDIQYVYINGRPVRDKTLNHAIRQAYEGLIPAGRMATYVIFLEIDARFVDVNVHPTKHEVRFSQQRLVHDLLAKSISDALSSASPQQRTVLPESAFFAEQSALDAKDDNRVVATPNIREGAPVGYSATRQTASIRPSSNVYSSFKPADEEPSFDTSIRTPYSAPFSNVNDTFNSLHVLSAGDNFFISEVNRQTVAVRADRLLRDYLCCLIAGSLKTQSKPLLFPYHLNLPLEQLEDFACHQLLQKLGFDCVPGKEQQIEIRQLPLWLSSLDNSVIFSALPEWLSQWMTHQDSRLLAEQIVNLFDAIPPHLAQQLLNEMLAMEPSVDSDDWLRTLDSLTLTGLFP